MTGGGRQERNARSESTLGDTWEKGGRKVVSGGLSGAPVQPLLMFQVVKNTDLFFSHREEERKGHENSLSHENRQEPLGWIQALRSSNLSKILLFWLWSLSFLNESDWARRASGVPSYSNTFRFLSRNSGKTRAEVLVRVRTNKYLVTRMSSGLCRGWWGKPVSQARLQKWMEGGSLIHLTLCLKKIKPRM